MTEQEYTVPQAAQSLFKAILGILGYRMLGAQLRQEGYVIRDYQYEN